MRQFKKTLRHAIASALIFGSTLGVTPARAEPATGSICNAGECTAMDPLAAIALMAAGGLVAELNKDQPFGPHNEITQILHAEVIDNKIVLGGDHVLFDLPVIDRGHVNVGGTRVFDLPTFGGDHGGLGITIGDWKF